VLKIRARDFNLVPKEEVKNQIPAVAVVEAQDTNDNISGVTKRLDDMALSIKVITKFIEEQR
jgi:hypothetical protein